MLLSSQYLPLNCGWRGLSHTIRMKRRDFIELAAIGASGLLIRPRPAFAGPFATGKSPAAHDPDLIVVNAKVYTVDSRAPRVEALAVTDGRFSAIGGSADVTGLATKGTRIVDAKGLTIVPGFIDTHLHASGTMLLYGTLVGHPFEVEFTTIDSVVEKLRAKARATPPGTWVTGYFH